VLDVQPTKEVQPLELPVKSLAHVPDQDNILVFMTLKAAVSVELAHKVLDGSSDKIDSDATELDKLVTAFPGSMRFPGLASDVKPTKEDLPTKDNVKTLPPCNGNLQYLGIYDTQSCGVCRTCPQGAGWVVRADRLGCDRIR